MLNIKHINYRRVQLIKRIKPVGQFLKEGPVLQLREGSHVDVRPLYLQIRHLAQTLFQYRVVQYLLPFRIGVVLFTTRSFIEKKRAILHQIGILYHLRNNLFTHFLVYFLGFLTEQQLDVDPIQLHAQSGIGLQLEECHEVGIERKPVSIALQQQGQADQCPLRHLPVCMAIRIEQPAHLTCIETIQHTQHHGRDHQTKVFWSQRFRVQKVGGLGHLGDTPATIGPNGQEQPAVVLFVGQQQSVKRFSVVWHQAAYSHVIGEGFQLMQQFCHPASLACRLAGTT